MKQGIRRRLIFLFVSAAIIECILMITLSVAMLVSSRSLSESYNSNIRLHEFRRISKQLYDDLDAYIQIKSYENINSYLKNKSLLERMTLDLNRKPSGELLKLQEYSVYKFSETFMNYGDRAVYQKRAGENYLAMENFRKAEKAFSYLSVAIEKLNGFYFEDNISRFNGIKDLSKKISLSCMVVAIIVTALVVIILSIFVSAIIRPLTEISESANQIAERNFDVPLFTYNKNDEIGNICRAFNKMIISIREYIDTIWEKAIHESELREKEMKMNELYQEAKLNVLQSQINPHFLFNTLNTGAQLAMMEGNDRTCDFLEKVAEFYRYNLQFTGHESVLKDEIQTLDNYIYIMKVRFGEHFNYSTEINSENLNVTIPGMILQPLVENCIKHGFKDMPKGGQIILKVADEDDFTVVTVSDNGCGFPEQRRIEILSGNFEKKADNESQNDSGTGVGISNVINRLKLFYKTDKVFDIQKSDSGGTRFIIRIKH